VLADDADVTQSKAYFKAGAAAYEMGDYLAAIQALQAAYKLTPLPAIAFSLAQASRRQYFVSHDPEHLRAAIELFRTYLRQGTSKGRRADAADALGQLEPLAAANASVAGNAADAGFARPERTRLLISGSTPRATVSLDGNAAAAAPLIAQVAPGTHQLRVVADGFFPYERSVQAVAGELVPVEVTLRERPATVVVRATPGANLYVDGSFVQYVETGKRLTLPSGSHAFTFTKNGYRVQAVSTQLEPGATRSIDANLHQTPQRTAAIVLLAVSGATLGAGALLTGLAIDRENAASKILEHRSMRNITSSEFSAYRDAVSERGRLRALAIGSFVGSAAALVTGLFLYAVDQPDPREQPMGAKRPSSDVRVGWRGPWPGHARAVEMRLTF
jgi:hypothetical protein